MFGIESGDTGRGVEVVVTKLEGPFWACERREVVGDLVADVWQCDIESDAQASQ